MSVWDEWPESSAGVWDTTERWGNVEGLVSLALVTNEHFESCSAADIVISESMKGEPTWKSRFC